MMTRMMTLLVGAAVLPALAACGGGTGDNASTADLNSLATAEQNQTASTANPLMDAHMRMQSAMTGAQGANASETWARKMIEHHRGAIEMSETLLQQGGEPIVLEMARRMAAEQRRDQQELERMLQAGISGGPGPANPFAEAEARMNERMMAASGATPSETFVRMMIEHHRGAVAMSEILIRQGGSPEVVAMARRAVEKQNRDIAELERLMSGEHQAADVSRTEAADQDAAPAGARPPAAAPQRPAARPERPAPRPKAEPNPHAGHDMGNMANMSH